MPGEFQLDTTWPGSNVPSNHYLHRFHEVKKDLTKIYSDLTSYIKDCLIFFDNEIGSESRFSGLIDEDVRHKLSTSLDKVVAIQSIIERNQMKCAFFGRTSNGKSTVVNALLGRHILPTGLGHTTNCFLQIEGTDLSHGFISSGEASSHSQLQKTTTSLGDMLQMSSALSSEGLPPDSLVKVAWPSAHCSLLKEGVVLLDSPGIDIDSDMDAWIDSFCLDADVFVMVANAESTLMQSEKKFFHKVSQKLSKPNIFILNNRWDVSINEPMADQVHDQHVERCITFLSEELQVCSRSEAESRIFFVSAREVLITRSKASGDHESPPNNLDLAEGWQSRVFEFINFEKNFQKNLSESATRTKFEAHCKESIQIISLVKGLMDRVFESVSDERKAAARFQTVILNQLCSMEDQLTRTTNSLNSKLHTVLDSVDHRTCSSLLSEIRRLPCLVEQVDLPFTPDQVGALSLYKKNLNDHLGKEIVDSMRRECAAAIISLVRSTKQEMLAYYTTLPIEQMTRNELNKRLDLEDVFEPEISMDCRTICADFQEDLNFRFSFGLTELYRKMVGRNYNNRLVLPSTRNQNLSPVRRRISPRLSSNGRPRSTSNHHESQTRSPPQSSYSLVSIALPTLSPGFLPRSMLGPVIVVGIGVKATGWRILGIFGLIYAGLYLYERLSWTSRVKEQTFKRQYVEYASQKLRLIVHLIGTNVAHQVKQDLVGTQRSLRNTVDCCVADWQAEVIKLDTDIERLDNIISHCKKLRNTATYMTNYIYDFDQEFMNYL